MATFLKTRDRNVIPRWRDFRSTLGMGELEHAVGSRRALYVAPDLSTLKEEWEANRSLAFAGDLLSASSFSIDKAAAQEAAHYVLDQKISLGDEHPLVSLALSALAPSVTDFAVDIPLRHSGTTSDEIATLRRRLNIFPHNAIDWVDLSLMYASRGLSGKARRAMFAALGIAPDNRFVLRSAARLFLHLGEYDIAHDILRRSPIAKIDPWVCASEIAVATSTKRQSRSVDFGLDILRQKHFSDHDTSELSSALGMLDFVNGSSRNARKHIRHSLLAPNENSLAQARWMAKDMAGLQVSVSTEDFHVARPFEAAAWQAYIQTDWTKAVKNAESWIEDEPFSTRPAQLAVHLYSTQLEDFDKAILLTKRGLIANPHEHGFRITLAFAYASSNRTGEAHEELREIKGPMSAEIEVAKIANFGLIGFREGDLERGRTFYLKAVDVASTKENRALLASALAYWAREEVLFGNRADAIQILERAKEVDKTVLSIDNPLLIEKVEQLLAKPQISKRQETTLHTEARNETVTYDRDNLGIVKISW